MSVHLLQTRSLFVLFSSTLSIIIGLIVLIGGWYLDIGLLKSIQPIWVSMKANTALCFILIGLSLLSTQSFTQGKNYQHYIILFKIVALTVGMIGSLTLIEYFFSIDLGIDQLLIYEPFSTVATSHSGRMAPETALCFIFLSIALWLKNSSIPNQALISAGLGIFVINLASVDILSYFTPQLGEFGWFGFTMMAMHTAVLFTLLGGSIAVTAWRQIELFCGIDKNTALTFAISLFILILIGFNTHRYQYLLKQNQQGVLLNEEFSSAMGNIFAHISKHQTQTSGYLLTQDSFYLQAMQESENNLSDDLRRLNDFPFLVNNLFFQEDVNTIQQLVKQQLAWHHHVVSIVNQIDKQQLRQEVNHGTLLLDALTNVIVAEKQEHMIKGKELKQQVEKTLDFSYHMVFFGTLTSLVIFFIGLFKINKAEQQRQHTDYLLKERIKELQAFYHLSKLAEKDDLPIATLFEQMTEILPQSWQYSEITCCQIVKHDKVFQTTNFMQTPWQQTASLKANGKIIGTITIGYLTEKPAQDEGPFFKEERQLLNSIAESLGHIYERKKIQNELLQDKKRLECFLSLAEMVNSPLKDIESFVVERCVEMTASEMGFCGKLNAGLQSMTTQVFSKRVMQQCMVADTNMNGNYQSWEFPLQNAGLWAEAIRKKEVVLINDYSAPHPAKRGLPDGHIMLKRFLAVPVLDNGQPVALVAVANKEEEYQEADILHLRLFADGLHRMLRQWQDRQALKEREVSYHGLFESITDVVGIQDSKGRFLNVNQAAVNMLGYPKEFFIGKTPECFAAPEKNDFAMIAKAIEKAFAGEKQCFEFWARCNNGEVFPHEVHLSKGVYFGQPVIIAVVRDISERKRTEQALKQALQDAEEANIAKKDFLASMRHELFTPMNIILGFGQILQYEALNEEQQSYIHSILTAGYHLLDLIKEVLDFSIIQSTPLVVNTEPLDLGIIVQECLALIQPLAASKNITIIHQPNCYCNIVVHANYERLKQVLLNLLSNAVKYNCDNGSITIMCSCDLKTVKLAISDTGVGLRPEQIAKLFQPFERLHAKNSATEGAGLGLAISKKLIDAMNGNLSVSSIVGKGCCFLLELPCALTLRDAHFE